VLESRVTYHPIATHGMLRRAVARDPEDRLMTTTCVLRRALFGLTMAAGLAVTPAYAISLEPGNWQDTETGSEDGKPVPPQVSTECMSPEEAKDPVKALTSMKDQAGQCEKLDVKENGNTVVFVMKCGDPKQMSIDMEATYVFHSAKHYSGTAKSTVVMAGKKSTADKKVDSVWLGACPKKP
jgi:hypothetical protein